jgi:ADP-dependent phosphofructokinase/glucokinase
MLEPIDFALDSENLVFDCRFFGGHSSEVGSEAPTYASSLGAAVQMASARYHFGDSMTLTQYESVASFAPNAVAGGVKDALSSYYAQDAAFSPGFQLDTEIPTTIGLGDSFIGGFLAQRALEMDEETL